MQAYIEPLWFVLFTIKHTKKDAKCSEVITALKPTTGTNAARRVPKTTCLYRSTQKNLPGANLHLPNIDII